MSATYTVQLLSFEKQQVTYLAVVKVSSKLVNADSYRDGYSKCVSKRKLANVLNDHIFANATTFLCLFFSKSVLNQPLQKTGKCFTINGVSVL